jgi:hypothetical protein
MLKTWYNFLKSSSNLVADTINDSELSVMDGCKLSTLEYVLYDLYINLKQKPIVTPYILLIIGMQWEKGNTMNVNLNLIDASMCLKCA